MDRGWAKYLNLFCVVFQIALYCYYLKNKFSAKQVNCSHNKLFFAKYYLFFAQIELYLYSNKVIENLFFV